MFSVQENGIISRGKEASFKTKMSSMQEKTNLYVGWKVTETEKTNTDWINSGEVLKEAIEEKIIMDIEKEEVNIDIVEILPNISKEEREYIVIYKGELHYVSNNKIKNNSQYVKWCKEIGIKILEYSGASGIVVRNGNYEKVNGIYLCTPKLDEGFNESRTRYLEVGNNGFLTPKKRAPPYDL